MPRPTQAFWSVPVATREAVRGAIAVVEGRGETPTTRNVRPLAGVAGGDVTTLVREYKARRTPPLSAPWTDPPAASRSTPAADELDLAALIAGAQSLDALAAVTREVTVRTACGEVPDSRARALQGLLAEQRHQLRTALAVPKDDPEQTYLLSEDGGRLVAAYERIVCDERRARALQFVADLLEEDARELPSVDPVGAL